MVVNKDMERTCPVRFEIKNFKGAGKAVLRILRGPRVDATNEDDPGEVTVETKTLVVREGRFDGELPPHSLTAVEVVSARAEKADLRKKRP
jgi:alpha-L-arabinofuranosidase